MTPISPFPAAIATAFPLATKAGAEILRSGGNAVDAAVGAAFALGVCEPSASGLGGQSVILIRFAGGRTTIIDGHSRAPAAASLELISREEQRTGRRATTIPTTAATLQYAQAKYGRLPWHQTLEPAIGIAEEGYRITPLQHRQAGWATPALDHAAAALYLVQGAPPPVDHMLRQPSLATTLGRIAAYGADDFYRGGIARAIADDMERHGGLLTAEDLAGFDAPRECPPISACYRGHRVVTAPRPGGGPELLLALQLLERLLAGDATAEERHLATALTTAAVFRWREQNVGGPSQAAATEEDWSALAIATQLPDPVWFARPAAVAAEEPGDTTHLSVCDHDGTVVALTQSIQSLFGAKAAHQGLGFLYNNYLRTCPRRPHPYQLGPGCRPRSNAAPTLVLDGADESTRPLLALGAAGSRRITSSILQVVTGVIDRRLDIAAAVAATRVHGLTNGKVWLEAPAASERLLLRLEAQGCRPIVKPAHSYTMGAAQALHFPASGVVQGAADPRRDGSAAILPQRDEGSLP